MKQTETQHSLPLVATAAAIAVAFWSLKPILISLIGDRASYLEVYLVAGVISVAVSFIIAMVRLRDVIGLLRDRRSRYGAGQAAIAGICLAAWYYGFYRALYGSAKVEATIIAFSWPLIAVFAMRLFAAEKARALTRMEFALVAVAFIGAISIGLAQVNSFDTGGDFEIIFAFLAAIGSGFYLPFAINASTRYSEIQGSKVFGTFVAISIANLVALIFVSAITYGTGQTLLFYAFDPQVILLCALIGIGTYLVAEITWTWAFAEYRSVTLTSLPYFSPALSVVMLYLFFDEPVTALAAFGLTLILFSNLSLHGMYQSNNAIALALVATLYVAVASVLLPRLDIPALPEMLGLIAGVFAILSGFVLSRVSNRRAAELDQRAGLTRDLLDLRIADESPTASLVPEDQIDAVFRGLIDLEYEDDALVKDRIAERVRGDLMVIGQRAPQARRQILRGFDLWYTIHRDRLSIGEKLALWLTGGSSILFLTLLRPDSFFGQIGLYAFSAGCFLLIFTIADYERSNVQGFRKHILRLQHPFREMGRDYYLPSRVVATNEVHVLPKDRATRYTDEDGQLRQMEIGSGSNSFRTIYYACSGLLLAALVFLPTSVSEVHERDFGAIMRPETFSEQLAGAIGVSRPDVVIGRFDWDTSTIIAHILAELLERELGLSAAIRQAEVGTIFEELAAPNGRFDVHPDFWLHNQPEAAARYVFGEKSVFLNTTPYLGRQGIYMPAEAAHRLQIAHIADLADPAVAMRFDTSNDRRGAIWAGAPGWLSTRVLKTALTEAGLADHWTFETYSETIFKARLRQSLAAGQSLVFYGYEPDWIHAAFDLVRLADDDADARPCLRPLQHGGTVCGFPAVNVHIAFGAYLAQSQPEAAALLSQVQFSTEDVSQWLLSLSRDNARPEDIAQAWLDQNAQQISTWLGR